MDGDQELIVLAAKAAGIDGKWLDNEFWLNGDRTPDNYQTWAPLQRDGDTLRLAVALNMDIAISGTAVKVVAVQLGSDDPVVSRQVINFSGESFLKDYAVRLAIVRAAAEIGKLEHE